jgi:hypothetical protein
MGSKGNECACQKTYPILEPKRKLQCEWGIMTSGEQSVIMALGEIRRIQPGKRLAMTKREGYLDEARLLSSREPLNLASSQEWIRAIKDGSTYAHWIGPLSDCWYIPRIRTWG